MTAALVHGNPESAAIWRPLIEQLGRDDVITLSPPGFGAPVPEGWSATRDAYRDWLVSELEALDGPVDLVGHDWGGGHVLAVAISRPDLLRSWCIDVAGIFHPDYVWHDVAQLWITPDVGEETVAAMADQPLSERAAAYESLGMPADIASEVAAACDRDMARCILELYRDATSPALADVASTIPDAAARPGLVLIAEDDSFVGSPAMATAIAGRAGASVTTLAGVGHWWMLQRPADGAAALEAFWAGLAGPEG